MTVVAFDSLPDHPADPLFAFLAQQSRDRSDPTVQRYREVVQSLLEFMEAVDVTPVYGPEIAHHLDQQRSRGSHAFLPTVGYAGLVRALPLFLTEPWLPPAGAQRRAHRSLIERLLVFLRRQGLVDASALRTDLKAARRAVSSARSRDYGWTRPADRVVSADTTVVTVDLRLPTDVLDRILATIEVEDRGSLAEYIADALTPTPIHDGRFDEQSWFDA